MDEPTQPTAEQAIRALAAHIASGGRAGDKPPWLDQFLAARMLSCPPWEIDAVFERRHEATRKVWVERAAIVANAQEQAQEIAQKRVQVAQAQRQAGGGLLVPAR